MTVGMPGSGIGGLFYLLCALMMPLCEMWRTLRGRGTWAGWRAAVFQAGLALMILAVLWATAWGLGILIDAPESSPTQASTIDGRRSGTTLPRVLGYSVLTVSFVTLAAILGSVQLLRVWAWLTAPARPGRSDAGPGAGGAAMLLLCVLCPNALEAQPGAPFIEPLLGWSRDSDGNTRWRGQLGGEVPLGKGNEQEGRHEGEGGRMGAALGRSLVMAPDGESGGTDRAALTDFMITSKWRPRPWMRLNADGGLAVRDSVVSDVIPLANLRLQLAAPGNKARLDLRAYRRMLDATPLLVHNRVVRSEVVVRPEVALSRIMRARAFGSAGWISAEGETNTRSAAGAGFAWLPVPIAEVSANVAQSGNARAPEAGYFAPERIQSAELGTYAEFEGDLFLLALDAGAGIERFRRHGDDYGEWRAALRAYALASWRFHPRWETRLEIDTYDSRAGLVAAGGSGWRYASISGSLRASM
jgi:hypothetical protein